MKAPSLCDMHVHSQNSHDSIAPVRDTAVACIENGISVFAVTDHCDIQYYEECNVRAGIEASVTETERTAEEFAGQITVLKGIEVGEGLWNSAHTDEILNAFSYDVIIGSVHAVRYKSYTDPYSTIDFSKMSSEDLDGYLSLYFDEVLETVRQIPCDVMAHLTCPLRYINGKYGLGADVKKYEEKISRILAHIIKHSVAMEINTSGIGAAYGCFMPDKWIVKKYREMGGHLITLGSDAHLPENVGNGFGEAIVLLRECGFKAYYYFQNRTAIPVEL